MFEEEVRRRIRFPPAPDWVREQPFVRPARLDAALAPWGFYTWLMDDQARLDRRPQRYNRTIEEIVNLSALQELANISVPFNPYDDDLQFHHVRIRCIRLRNQQGLATALCRKVRPPRIRHPDLNRAKPRHAQRIAPLLNPCGDRNSHWKPLFVRYMQRA